MRSPKKYVLVSIGFALAGMFGAAFGSGPAHALVATLVQIVNTAASPVITQHVAADNPATQAVWLRCLAGAAGSASCQLKDIHGPYTVPAGNRFVVESISGEYNVPKGSGSAIVSYDVGDGSFASFFYVAATYQSTEGSSDFYVWGLSARFYVESGSTLSASVTTPNASTVTTGDFDAFGHLEAIQ